MNDHDITRALERLVGPFDHEQGDWELLLEQLRTVETPGHPRRRLRTPPRRSLLILGAAVAVSVAIALTVTSPWRGGPSILDRAAAAIASPPDRVLHESVIIREQVPCILPKAPPNPSKLSHLRLCAVRGRGSIWFDDGPSHRFRATVVDPTGRSDEAGGSVGAASGLRYQPAEKVLDPVTFDFRVSRSDLDPVAFARAALTSGRARLDGSTTIRGQKVLRIRVIAHRFGHDVTDALYFVDPHTYRPVRIVFTPGYKPTLRGLPLINIPLGGGSGATLPSALIFDIVGYEHLAPTPENRKLADIRAQHPHAKVL